MASELVMVPSASGFEKHSNWMAWAPAHIVTCTAVSINVLYSIWTTSTMLTTTPPSTEREKNVPPKRRDTRKKQAISISEYISSRNQDVRQTRPFAHSHSAFGAIVASAHQENALGCITTAHDTTARTWRCSAIHTLERPVSTEDPNDTRLARSHIILI